MNSSAKSCVGYTEEQAKKGITTISRGQQTDDGEHAAAASFGVTGTNTPRPSGSGATEPDLDLDQQSEPFRNIDSILGQHAGPDDTTTVTSIHGAKSAIPLPGSHTPSIPSDSSQPIPIEPSSLIEQATHISGALKTSDPEHNVTGNISTEKSSKT